MSRPVDDHGEPSVPADQQRAPLYRVMIGCGIAGVLIAIGAAVVNFGTGRGSDRPSRHERQFVQLVPGPAASVPAAPGRPVR